MALPLRIVLVGCGGISKTWLDAIRNIPDITMVGFVDLYKDLAQQRARDYGWNEAVVDTNLGNVLDRTSPDAVFNCTVPEANLTVTLQALEAGCHVLGEKPLADSMENARKLARAATDAGRIFAVIQNRRYDPNIRRLCSFLNSGAIGKVTMVDSDFYIGAHFGGFRDHMKHVLLLDMAIHTFDAARLISGADPLTSTCLEWNPSGSWYDHDAAAVAVFQMTNDIVYSYRGSWCAEGLSTPWESKWRITGTEGSVAWDGAEHLEAEVVRETGEFLSKVESIEVPAIDPGDKIGQHAGVIKEFIYSIRHGETPETICSDNVKSLSMVFGAIESAERGQCIELDTL
jgi:predicted dehydrogenase